MGLVQMATGALKRVDLGSWRHQYDFDAPGLPVRTQVMRLEYAAWQALKRACDEGARDELVFILGECRELLQVECLEGEAAEEALVQQRLLRVKRVVNYYEGSLSRLNRRYWWLPFSAMLLLMGCWFFQCLPAL